MSRDFIYDLDIENLVGYFECQLLHAPTSTRWSFVLTPFGPPPDRARLADILKQVTIRTFNGMNYDMPVLAAFLAGADNATLKAIGDAIITRGMRPWKVYEWTGMYLPEYVDHIDIAEVAPGVRISLKAYGGRLHAPTIQDLPVDPMAPLSPLLFNDVSLYCGNDLDTTALLADGLADRIRLREAITEKYGVDVRSKSDAQIAEAVFKASLGFDPQKRYIQHGFTFRYTPPAFIRFVSRDLNDLLHLISNTDFTVTDKEEAVMLYGDEASDIKTGVQIPRELKGRDIIIGGSKYRIGIGGLHSQEETRYFKSQPGVLTIEDIDVKSYYPSLILLMAMNPVQLGEHFQNLYRTIYTERLHNKSEVERLEALRGCMGGTFEDDVLVELSKAKTIADGYKIVLNGTFGKLFSKYSIFYAPEFGIATTITGQLALLMLIEMMELSGVHVISANTDGITLAIPHGMKVIADSNVAWWEKATGLEMEYTPYEALYQRDVNNYIAITTSGKVKRNGTFRPSGLLSGPQGKHPDRDICADAVVAYLKDGVPLSKTITDCKDIRKFVTIRNVKGGGYYIDNEKPPVHLGKVVRWYYAYVAGTRIVNKDGHQVASSENCVPAMTLPLLFPEDVDHQRYIGIAQDMLRSLGVR